VLRVLAASILVTAAVAGLEQHDFVDSHHARLLDALLVQRAPAEAFGEVVSSSGDAWAYDDDRGLVLRLDGRSGRVRARIGMRGRVALAADREGVWALRWGGRFWRRPNGPLLRIDPATNRIAAHIPLPPASGEPMLAFGVLAGDSGVWVWGPSRILHLDRETASFVQDFKVGQRHGELTGAILTEGGLLAVAADGHLLRVDARIGVRTAGRQPALTAVELLELTGRRLVATAGGMLFAVDASTGRLLWHRRFGFHVDTVIDYDGVLLAQGSALGDSGDRLWAIDGTTGRVCASTLLPSLGTVGMTSVHGALWITTVDGHVIAIPRLLTRLFVGRGCAQTVAAPGGRGGR
jgi:outer membrane protein assembly factor BamB